MRQHVLVIPDGAADRHRDAQGRSPLERARTPHMDRMADEGVSGRMVSLYAGLPRESLVAQMGMLGWDPWRHYPGGRASCELAARGDVALEAGDLAFRANLATMRGRVLESYSAGLIRDEDARPLVARVNAALAAEYPGVELYHNSDFRATLVVRGADAEPERLACPEPHECEGMEFDPAALLRGEGARAEAVAGLLNRYAARAAAVLAGERANALFPWSPSRPLLLPSFAESTGFAGRAAVVGAMDFLAGLTHAGGMEFHRVGNGRPETDFRGKGACVVELLAAGCGLVVCHVNAPDEASHLHDVELKVRSLEEVDRWVVGPVAEYFRARPEALGGVMVAPDHYTNVLADASGGRRSEAHTLDPAPFVLWNGRERDEVRSFGEDAAAAGRYGAEPVSHLALLGLLGGDAFAAPRAPRRAGYTTAPPSTSSARPSK